MSLSESKSYSVSPRLGVAVLVVDGTGRLLLGKRGKEPNLGKWVIPGGGIRFGEDWATAGARELYEETGLSITIDREQIPRVMEVFGVNEHRVILLVHGRIVEGALRPSSDLLDACFFDRNSIPTTEVSPVVLPMLAKLGWVYGAAEILNP